MINPELYPDPESEPRGPSWDDDGPDTDDQVQCAACYFWIHDDESVRIVLPRPYPPITYCRPCHNQIEARR